MTGEWVLYRCTGCGVEQTVPAWLVAKRYRWVPVHYAENDRDICGRMQRVNPVAG